MKLLIAVAGPYSADTDIRKKENLDKMNEAAARVYEKGHIRVIGVNAALFVYEKLSGDYKSNAIMDISLALVDKCDALLLTGESPGANKERDLILSKGKKVYYDINEIPDA